MRLHQHEATVITMATSFIVKKSYVFSNILMTRMEEREEGHWGRVSMSLNNIILSFQIKMARNMSKKLGAKSIMAIYLFMKTVIEARGMRESPRRTKGSRNPTTHHCSSPARLQNIYVCIVSFC